MTHYLKEPTNCDTHGFRSWSQVCPYCKEDGKDDEIERLREGLKTAIQQLYRAGFHVTADKLKAYLEPGEKE